MEEHIAEDDVGDDRAANPRAEEADAMDALDEIADGQAAESSERCAAEQCERKVATDAAWRCATCPNVYCTRHGDEDFTTRMCAVCRAVAALDARPFWKGVMAEYRHEQPMRTTSYTCSPVFVSKGEIIGFRTMRSRNRQRVERARQRRQAEAAKRAAKKVEQNADAGTTAMAVDEGDGRTADGGQHQTLGELRASQRNQLRDAHERARGRLADARAEGNDAHARVIRTQMDAICREFRKVGGSGGKELGRKAAATRRHRKHMMHARKKTRGETRGHDAEAAEAILDDWRTQAEKDKDTLDDADLAAWGGGRLVNPPPPEMTGHAACRIHGYNVVRPKLSAAALIHLLQRRLTVRNLKEERDQSERANHAFLVRLRTVLSGNEQAAEHYATLLQLGYTDLLLWTCTRDEIESIKRNGRVKCGRYYAVALDPHLDPENEMAGQRVRLAVMHGLRMLLVSGNRKRILEAFCAREAKAYRKKAKAQAMGVTLAWIEKWARLTEVAQDTYDRQERRDDAFAQLDAGNMRQAEWLARGAPGRARPEARVDEDHFQRMAEGIAALEAARNQNRVEADRERREAGEQVDARAAGWELGVDLDDAEDVQQRMMPQRVCTWGPAGIGFR